MSTLVTYKMQTQSLQSIVLKHIYQHIWSHSNLPKYGAKFGYANRPFKDGSFDDCSEDIVFETIQPKINKELEYIKAGLTKVQLLSTVLQAKILTTIAEASYNANTFALNLVFLHKKIKKSKIEYCLKNIVFDCDGQIDTLATVFNVTRNSQFEVCFSYTFLADFGIVKESFTGTYENVLKDLNTSNQNRKPIDKVIKRMNKYLDNIGDPSYYVGLDSRLCGSDDVRHYLSSGWEKACLKSNGLMSYYINLITKKARDKNENVNLTEIFKKGAIYAFESNCYSLESVLVFYKNLHEDGWNEILERYFVEIILIFLKSWKYRNLAVVYFKKYKHLMNVSDVRKISWSIFDYCVNNPYLFFDFINVIQLIWLELPNNIKNDFEICNLIAWLASIGPQDNFELIDFLINDYKDEIKKDILVKYLMNVIISNKSYNDNMNLKSIEGMHINNLKALITVDIFKQFLIFGARFKRNWYVNLDGILEAMNVKDEIKFKNDLFDDNEFVTQLLADTAYRKRHFESLFIWGLGNTDNFIKFKEKLKNTKIINDVYEWRLIESDSDDEAEDILRLLKYKTEQISSVKEQVNENPFVIKVLLAKILQNSPYDWSLSDVLEKALLKNNFAKGQQVMEDLFESDLVEVIIDYCTTIKTLETSPSLQTPGAIIMANFVKFIKRFIKPFGLTDKLIAKLDEISEDEIIQRKVVVKNKRDLTQEDEDKAKQYSVAIFKSIKYIMNNETITDRDLLSLTNDNINIVEMYELVRNRYGDQPH